MTTSAELFLYHPDSHLISVGSLQFFFLIVFVLGSTCSLSYEAITFLVLILAFAQLLLYPSVYDTDFGPYFISFVCMRRVVNTAENVIRYSKHSYIMTPVLNLLQIAPPPRSRTLLQRDGLG